MTATHSAWSILLKLEELMRGSRVACAVGVAGLTLGTAGPALAGANIVRPTQCGYTLGPGETEVIPGTGITENIVASSCQIVFTPTGRANFVLHAEVPAGYSSERALVAGGTIVTPSGRIMGHGSFGP